MAAPDPIAELEALLADPALPDEVMLVSQLDGLIAAVLVVPGLAETPWLPLAWGGGDPPFDAAALARLEALATARRTQVVGELLRGGMAYGPLFDLDPRYDDEPLWETWMEGFAFGAAQAGERWTALLDHADADLAAAAAGLSLLADAARNPKRYRKLAADAPDLIPELVEALYRRGRGLARVPDGPERRPLVR